MKDPFRSVAYAAERRAFGENSRGVSRPDFHGEELPFHPSIDRPETILVWMAELKSRFPSLFPCPIRVLNRHQTMGANARFYRRENRAVLSFGLVAKRWVVLHEIAHVLSGARGDGGGHGLGWAKAYLELVLAVFGQTDHDRLEAQFLRAGYPLF